MILCGSISDPTLRERLTELAQASAWDSWITSDASMLPRLLDAARVRPDAIVSDQRRTLESLTDSNAARILLAPQGNEDRALFVVGTQVSDAVLKQRLLNCINARRLQVRFADADAREPITHLPRHRELVSRLEQFRGKPLALLVVQVDHAGHLYTNLDPVSRTDLLNALANRLKLAVPGNGLIGIYDAGCFIVSLPDQGADAMLRTADDIRSAAQLPLRYSGGEIHLTVSVGCHQTPDYQQFDNLWHGARQATNRAVRQGGNQIENGPPDPMTTRLPSALERDEFSLMLQGQFSAERLTGVEALLRWQGLEVGELAPGHFIPIAEQKGFITRIGDWVLEQASRAASTWLEHLVQPMILGVNVSPQQFVNQAITRQIGRLHTDRWLDPAMLELELPQDNLLALVDQHRDQLYRLRDWGVRFAIDNLGTKLIDLDRLLRCPVDTLKIDPSLIAQATEQPASRKLLEEITAIGERFNLRVVAVGVETPAQLQILQSLGQIELQGYLLAPPVPMSEFHQLLSASQPLLNEM